MEPATQARVMGGPRARVMGLRVGRGGGGRGTPNVVARPSRRMLPHRVGFKGGGKAHQTAHILFLANDTRLRDCDFVVAYCWSSFSYRPNFYSALRLAAVQSLPVLLRRLNLCIVNMCSY